MEIKRTELKEVGEFGLIGKIKEKFTLINEESEKGIGDDAAVIGVEGKKLVITTDMLLEGVHFDLTYVPIKHLGYKAVSVNVSDVASMYAIPKQITVNIAISNRFSVEAIEELYEGIRLACENYKVDLIGGDTTSSVSGLIISITAIGYTDPDKVVYRDGAKVNDLLCVTGDLGAAYMGLQVLEREKQVFLADPTMQPQLGEKEYIVSRQLKPEARMDMIYELRDLGIVPTSMIDISDGLASEVLHICTESKVGARVYEENLPIDNMTFDTAREFNLDPITCMMNGGEDYELLFTLDQKHFDKVKNNPNITIIGHITEASTGVNLVSKAGNTVPVTAQGWVHFR